MENSWRPRWEGESYHAYRERIVDKGDGDLFRGLQLMEAALDERTALQLRMICEFNAEAANHVQQLKTYASALALERGDPVPPREFALGSLKLQVGGCAQCKALWVEEACPTEPVRSLCSVCRQVHAVTDQWAPQMPTKVMRSQHKKKRKRKRTPVHVPTPVELQQLLVECPELQQRLLGQLPLSPDQRAWYNPFEDPHFG